MSKMPYVMVYADLKSTVDLLSDTEAGRLLKALLSYVNGEEAAVSGQEKLVYQMLKSQIDRDTEKYQSRAATNRENGRKGGAPAGNQNARKTTENNPKQPGTTENNQNQPKTTYKKEKEEEKDKDKDKEEGKDKDKEYIHDMRASEIAEIVDLLNDRAGTHYKPTTDATKRHINARLAEGYTVDDFRVVIDKKCAEWLGTDMEKFLRPETLFGSKFESYLNAPAHTGGKGKSNDPFGDMLREHEARMNAVEVEAEVYDF